MTHGIEAAPAASTRRIPLWGRALFVILMLGLTVVFVALGLWQMARLAEKEALIATVAARMDDPPAQLPPIAQWQSLNPDAYDYLPVSVTGHFVPNQTVLVFTSLSDPHGRYDGAGYWVVTPLALNGGGSIFVNRGFIPQERAPAYADGGLASDGEVTLAGVARKSEPGSSFTPPADPAKRIDYLRNVDRLATMTDPALAPFAPVYLDLPAGPAGALPQGGETIVEFPNNHFGYALTWFGFAIITPVMLLIWLLRQRRPRQLP